ncbi:MAG: DUF58 domain-containing protein, partial [Actinobacteria bacterium]|nr:DUF58 domain-containing protein [Actinomycetota bacterium]
MRNRVPRVHGRRRLRVHATPTGALVVLALVVSMAVAPQVADPRMAGFVWAAVLGMLLVGVLWPLITLLALRVEDGSSSAGSTRPVRAGTATEVRLRVGSRLSEVAVRWSRSPTVVDVAPGPVTGVGVPITPLRRGEYRRLRVRVSCDAPFGIVEVTRTEVIELEQPLVVGPFAVRSGEVRDPDGGVMGDLVASAIGHGGDTVRSVRPYVAGDPAHLVHWPSTARTGSLVVRELEPPAERAVAVVVDLGPAATTSPCGTGPGASAGPAPATRSFEPISPMA